MGGEFFLPRFVVVEPRREGIEAEGPQRRLGPLVRKGARRGRVADRRAQRANRQIRLARQEEDSIASGLLDATGPERSDPRERTDQHRAWLYETLSPPLGSRSKSRTPSRRSRSWMLRDSAGCRRSSSMRSEYGLPNAACIGRGGPGSCKPVPIDGTRMPRRLAPLTTALRFALPASGGGAIHPALRRQGVARGRNTCRSRTCNWE